MKKITLIGILLNMIIMPLCYSSDDTEWNFTSGNSLPSTNYDLNDDLFDLTHEFNSDIFDYDNRTQYGDNTQEDANSSTLSSTASSTKKRKPRKPNIPADKLTPEELQKRKKNNKAVLKFRLKQKTSNVQKCLVQHQLTHPSTLVKEHLSLLSQIDFLKQLLEKKETETLSSLHSCLNSEIKEHIGKPLQDIVNSDCLRFNKITSRINVNSDHSEIESLNLNNIQNYMAPLDEPITHHLTTSVNTALSYTPSQSTQE